VSEGLYQKVTDITEEYMGPATERFLIRHIMYHLNKSPQELTDDDIPTLIEWTRATLGLLTEDRDIIDEYVLKMSKLSRSHQ